MCEGPSGANVTEQFFIELQYFLDMLSFKIVFVLFYMFEIKKNFFMFLSVFFLFKNMVGAFYVLQC